MWGTSFLRESKSDWKTYTEIHQKGMIKIYICTEATTLEAKDMLQTCSTAFEVEERLDGQASEGVSLMFHRKDVPPGGRRVLVAGPREVR